MNKRLFKYLFIVVAIVILAGIVLNVRSQTAKVNLPTSIPVPVFEPVATPSPSKEVLVISPDGKATLMMKTQSSQNGITQTFFISGLESGTTEVFSGNFTAGQDAVIPFNTFSPDDKFVFLKEGQGSGSNFIVLTTNGNAIFPNYQTLSVSEFFSQKLAEYDLQDVTGWASPTLLVVNSAKKDGSNGPSFWFDVTTRSFIPLATRFN